MKSRTLPPMESPDVPYTPLRRKSRDQGGELKLPPYKTSLTPPSWPTEPAPVSVAEQKLVRAEMALEELARREQMLAVQVQAHRRCAAELAEERALLEAERSNHAQKMKSAEEALSQMREQLALETQALEGMRAGCNAGVDRGVDPAAHQEPPQSGIRPEDQPRATGSERIEGPAPDVGRFLSKLAKGAAEFAALVETVTEMKGHLAEERARHETMAEARMNEFRAKEEALARRESEEASRIDAATRQLDADRESMARAQQEFATAKTELAEWQRRLDANEKNLAEQEKAHASRTEKFREDEARVATRRNAIASVEESHRERESELRRLEQDFRDRAAELARHQSELITTEAEVRAAGCKAVSMQEGVKRLNAELDAGWAKLQSDTEALVAVRQEHESIRAALAAREKELEHKQLAFDERRRKLCETLSSFTGQ